MPEKRPTSGLARDVLPHWLSEAEFQQSVIEQLQALGYKVHAERPARTDKGWRTPIQGDPGFPDIVAVRARDKRLLFAELKLVGKKPTEVQQEWLDALDTVALAVAPLLAAHCPVLVLVLTPANWDKWLEMLK